VRPTTYPQAKDYLIAVGAWYRNFAYYEGSSVLSMAQQEFDRRKNDE